MGKVFVFNYNRCNGCRGCQVACKDEHCDQAWPPYSEAQPIIGQFWMKVTDRERGRVPWVKVTYELTWCNHCEKCALIEKAPEAVYRRDDGLVIIDPERAKGIEGLAEACPYGTVYWNEDLGLAQKCTGCAHLLDNGWEVPRCVDACATEALLYVDEEEARALGAEPSEQGKSTGSKIWYLNVPKRFIVGTLVDLEADEVVIGAKVELLAADGSVVAELETDDFGDFKFDQVEPADYKVLLSCGDKKIEVNADCTAEDIYVGVIDASA